MRAARPNCAPFVRLGDVGERDAVGHAVVVLVHVHARIAPSRHAFASQTARVKKYHQPADDNHNHSKHHALSGRQRDFLLAVGATGGAHAQQRRVLRGAPGCLSRTAVVDAGRVGRRHGRERKDLGPRVDARGEVAGSERAVAVLAVALARAERGDVHFLLHGAADRHEALRELAVARTQVPARVVVLRGTARAALLHVLRLASWLADAYSVEIAHMRKEAGVSSRAEHIGKGHPVHLPARARAQQVIRAKPASTVTRGSSSSSDLVEIDLDLAGGQASVDSLDCSIHSQMGMVVGIAVCSLASYYIYSGVACAVDRENLKWGIIMYSSYFALFLKFFIERYLLSPAKKAVSAGSLVKKKKKKTD